MKDNKNVYDAFIMIMQFSINMIVPILLCTALGVFIYKRTGQSLWAVLLFFVGAIAGFQNIYRMAKKIYNRKEKRNRHHVKKD